MMRAVLIVLAVIAVGRPVAAAPAPAPIVFFDIAGPDAAAVGPDDLEANRGQSDDVDHRQGDGEPCHHTGGSGGDIRRAQGTGPAGAVQIPGPRA